MKNEKKNVNGIFFVKRKSVDIFFSFLLSPPDKKLFALFVSTAHHTIFCYAKKKIVAGLCAFIIYIAYIYYHYVLSV